MQPAVASYLDRLSEIDWWEREYDVPAVKRAYAARLAVVGLMRRVVWTADPESRAAKAAKAARDARDARDAIGWLNLTIEPAPIWLLSLRDAYTPMIDAYLAGSGAHILTPDAIVVIAAPRVRMEAARRLHCETGPAVVWSRTVQHWWHGTEVPAEWIAQGCASTARQP